MSETPVAEWRYSRMMPSGAVAVQRTPMSDDQIQQAAMAEWLEALSALWNAYGKVPDAKQLAVYASILGDIPLGLLEEAIRRVLERHEYASVPTPAEVRRAAWEILGKPHDFTAAVEMWRERLFERCIVRFG